MLYFFPFAVAIVALIVAIRAFNQTSALRQRVYALERGAERPAAPATPPPILADAPRAAAAPPAETAPTATEAPPITPEPEPQSAATTPPPIPPAPPLQPEAQPSFEERIGTRWVVWVGGLTLALGGFFMVRYSIEAGLLGPGVRTILGGLFALALLAAGEWTRRKESISEIAALPIANIPAILTA